MIIFNQKLKKKIENNETIAVNFPVFFYEENYNENQSNDLFNTLT